MNEDAAAADVFTDSALRDLLCTEIVQTTPIQSKSQEFHFHLHTEFHKKIAEQLREKLINDIQLAASNAVIQHYTNIEAEKIADPAVAPEFRIKQAFSKLAFKGYMKNHPPNKTTVSISEELYPVVPLSGLHADEVDQLVHTEANVVGIGKRLLYIDKVVLQDGRTINYKTYNAQKDGKITEHLHRYVQHILCEEILSNQKDLHKMTVKVYGDFVGSLNIGDHVRLFGIYNTLPEDRNEEEKREYIDVINVQPIDDKKESILTQEELDKFTELSKDPEQYLKALTDSFAPHIYGNHLPKLGILCASMVGARTKSRSNLLVLLVGSPGVGKSEMLKAALQIHDNVAYVDAPNVSARGLLYGQEEFNKTKILRAGVLVRYNLCVIDELDKMGKGQRVELNTASEQQIASYHKTPFDVDTPINVAIIAGANPAGGRWLDERSIRENLKNLEDTVLDRYLIIKVDKPKDTNPAYDILMDMADLEDDSDDTLTTSPFTPEQLRGLINHCKKLNPKFTIQARKLTKEFLNSFKTIQQSSTADLVIEMRKENDLIRIIKKISKLLMKEEIDEECVKMGVKFYKECMASIGMATDAPTAQAMLDKDADPENVFWRVYREQITETGETTVDESTFKKALFASGRWRTVEKLDKFVQKMIVSQMVSPSPGRLKRI